jgi:hypothetical protein
MAVKEKPRKKAATAGSVSRTILPTDVYTLKAATELLGVRENTLPREIRLRRLRASRRGGRYYILGSWLLQWLEAGEIRRPAAEPVVPTQPAEAHAAAR